MIATAGGQTQLRSFPGRVEASRTAELAFQVPGLLIEMPVKEGQRVSKGDLIARLRPDEFKARLKTLQGQLDEARAALRALRAGQRPEEILRLEAQLRAAQARLANARIEYERSARLLQSRSISRSDYDLAETAYRVAQEEHEAARQTLEQGTIAREEDIDAQEAQVRGLEGRVVEANIQLADASLHAPYDGVVAQRFVEVDQNVQSKQPVVRFQDVEELEIAVDVPEAVMANLQISDVVRMDAEFSAAPGLRFPVEVRETAQTADPATQTFQVRVAMASPQEVRILPGMTANVVLTYRRASVLGQPILAPVEAVRKDDAGRQIAWIVGPDGVATSRPVQIGDVSGGWIEIVDGLQPGDRFAVAGVALLRDGMTVRDLGGELGGARP